MKVDIYYYSIYNNYRYIFHPSSYFKSYWDLGIHIVLIYSIIIIPVHIAFSQNDGSYQNGDMAIDIIFG